MPNPHEPLQAELDGNNVRLYIRLPDGSPMYAETLEAVTNMSVFRDGVVLNYFFDETVFPEDAEERKIQQRYHCKLRVEITKVEPSTYASKRPRRLPEGNLP